MTDRRDDELARLFQQSGVPDHGADFWANLRASVAETATTATTAGTGEPGQLLELGAATDPTRRWGSDRRRWLGPGVTAAAAVVLAAAVGVVLLGPGRTSGPADQPDLRTETTVDGDGPEPTGNRAGDPDGDTADGDGDPGEGDGSPTPSTPPSTDEPGPTFPPVEYTAAGAVVPLGAGQALGTSPDGSAILVLDDVDDPTDLGCEGAPRLMLYGQDVTTGQRRSLLPAGRTIETGGLDLLFAEPGRPLGGSPQTVLWTEYCDGERLGLWSATMAPDGHLTELTELPLGSGDDPFTGTDQRLAVARGLETADGANGVFAEGGTVVVRGLAPASDEEWVYPGTATEGWPPVFAPAGDVVVLNAGAETVFWRYRTGEVVRVPTGGQARYAFGADGAHVYVNTFDPLPAFGVLNLGAGPDPAPAATCSGGVDLGPVSVDGVPAGVADLAATIDQLASGCDWAGLADLIGPDFTASFGGGSAIELWTDQELRGQSPMLELRRILRQPAERSGGVGEVEPAWVWPAVFLHDCRTWSADDLASLRSLGYDDQRIADECEFGGYIGYRTAITESGRWRSFVAGD